MQFVSYETIVFSSLAKFRFFQFDELDFLKSTFPCARFRHDLAKKIKCDALRTTPVRWAMFLMTVNV